MNDVHEVTHEPHGHHHEHFCIVVNGREKIVVTKDVSFAEVVHLSGLPSGPNTVFTVTYRHAAGHKHNGTLTEGETVKVQDGTIFNVTATNKS